MPFSCFADAGFAKAFILKLGKHAVSVFCLPIHVPKVYANFVVVMFQFNIHKFHFKFLRAFFAELTLTRIVDECAEIPLRTHFLFKMVEKTYGGLSKAIPLHTNVCSILA